MERVGQYSCCRLSVSSFAVWYQLIGYQTMRLLSCGTCVQNLQTFRSQQALPKRYYLLSEFDAVIWLKTGVIS